MPFPDYTKTQRIVFLIDLQNIKNKNLLLSTLKTLISFPPFSTSSTLFSYKLFFSSLSPLFSPSSLSLSFHLPSPTFISLSHSLSSFPSPPPSSSFPLASHVASSLRQLLHDYPWDPPEASPDFVLSNVILLFSSVPKSLSSLAKFLNVDLGDECLNDLDCFRRKFRGFFGSVRDAFVSRDMHLGWIDMGGFGVRDEGIRFFESGVWDLGWGFCDIESVVLGSAVVPFGLIYPRIGVSPRLVDCCGEGTRVPLCLEIADVDGKPLECKCCDVELVSWDVFCKVNVVSVDSKIAGCCGKVIGWEEFRDENVKLCLKAVRMPQKFLEVGWSFSDTVLVREPLEKNRKEGCCEFIEEKVLELLGVDMGNSALRKTPIWQILLSFLYRENCCGLVSLFNGSGNFFTGVLKPFTVSSALLSIIGDEACSRHVMSAFGRECLDIKQSHGNLCSHPGAFMSDVCAGLESENPNKKKNRKNIKMLQDLTWTAFSDAALEQFQIHLEDIYFARECYKSKKLKFLKCWMKQTRKFNHHSLAIADRSNQCEDIPAPVDNRLPEFSQGSEHPVDSCASAADHPLRRASGMQDEAALDCSTETLESFFAGLPLKIQHGLELEEVNLGSLAERLVNSCIYWLYRKQSKETISAIESHGSDKASEYLVALELTKLLLKDPKDLATMYKHSDLSSQLTNQGSSQVTSGNAVRQYELQILFRLEILQSEVGVSLGESMTQKFVKQICSLLETLQCHMEGGFFGDWSLDKYVEKIIKSRYCYSIADVVQRIYAKMDLLLFSDAEQSSDPLLNSEESNHSQRGNLGRDEMGDSNRSNDSSSASAENKSVSAVKYERPIAPVMNWDEHTHKLIEAQQMRQRARRFASFTTWVPDLQRVWAPKQSKLSKPSSGPQKLSKRKEKRKFSHDVVFETPMTGNKCPFKDGIDSNDKAYQVHETPLCSSSVSKALFQGDQTCKEVHKLGLCSNNQI